MKILYFSQFDLLRPTTNRISDIRFCEGFAENGCDVEIVVPYVYRKHNIKASEVEASYGLEHPVKVTILPTPFWEDMNKWLNVPTLLAYQTLAYLRRLLRHRRDGEDVVVISRDVYSLMPVLWMRRLTGKGPCVIYWAHEVKPDNERYQWTYGHVDGVIGTNSAIADDLHTLCGIPRERLAITLNPISTRQVKLPTDKETARQHLNLNGKPLAVYTGKVGAGMHEINYILEAAALLPGYTFLFTGGKPEAVRHYEDYCAERGVKNAVFTGFLDKYTDVFLYQLAADALISYYTTKDHLVDYNYPQKITEYMLAGNPIVTPDYRATRDILHERNAMFVAPEDAENLAQGIRNVIEDRALGARLGQCARTDAIHITFKARTRMLMNFFQTL